MSNRLYTKRNGNAYSWLTMNTWFDSFIDDPEFDRDYSNLYNDIYWTPLPWLRLANESQFPAFGGDESFTEVNTRLTWMPMHSLELTLGHRWLADHPFFEDSKPDRFPRLRKSHRQLGAQPLSALRSGGRHSGDAAIQHPQRPQFLDRIAWRNHSRQPRRSRRLRIGSDLYFEGLSAALASDRRCPWRIGRISLLS